VTDPRPRPQYGEYATPEEQAKAMGVSTPADPAADGVSLRKDGTSTSASSGSTTSTSASHAPAPAGVESSTSTTPSGASATSAPGAGRPRRVWDSVLTAILLGIGIVSVTSSIPQYADFPATLELVFAQFGYSGYSEPDLATNVGIALNVAQIVLYVAGAAVALLMVRRNRLAFIYPLIAGVLFVILAFVLMTVVFAADPALIESITNM
jgi:hypothetical protein